MSGAMEMAGARPKEDPESLVLRGPDRPVARFRRGLIVGTAAALSAALAALCWIALEPVSLRRAADPEWSTQQAGKAVPDTLANVPRSYGDVPRLGPPLPGDLGRPILEHRRSLADPPRADWDAGGESSKARTEALAEARRSARSSPLMVERTAGEARQGLSAPAAPQPAAEPIDRPAEIPAGQQHKLDFVRQSDGDSASAGLRPSPSPWTLSAGTSIPASLLTGLNSDLPGMVVAQVTENVRDSATGRAVLVPQGARLLGHYDSVVAYGQKRALLVWTRILFPDGASIDLDHSPATDSAGHSGLSDKVDTHSLQLLKGIGLSTLLGLASELGSGGSGSAIARAIRQSATQGAASAGDQITIRNLDVQPTILVRPGWPVLAILGKDLILQPWRR